MKFLLLLIVSITLYANQQQCIQNVLNVARKYTNYPTTIAAIAMQESSCREQITGDDRTSFGVVQFQLVTARETLSFIPELKQLAFLNDKQLSSILLINPNLAIRLAAVRFERYRKRLGYQKAVQAHNGLNGNFRYFHKVEKWKRWLYGFR